MLVRRSNPLVIIVILMITFFPFIYLLWLKPSLFHAMNPKDPSPPEWGSSPAVSTDAGFLQGKWIAHNDPSSSRAKNEIAQFVINTANQTLEFLPGDRFVWINMGDVVKGTWKDEAARITLEPETVDDIPVKLTIDRLAAQQNLPVRSRERNQKWQSEGSSVVMVQRLSPIQLMPDKKRLFCAGNVNQNGQTFLGTTVWDRVRH